jgi:hypothetical protein
VCLCQVIKSFQNYRSVATSSYLIIVGHKNAIDIASWICNLMSEFATYIKVQFKLKFQTQCVKNQLKII